MTNNDPTGGEGKKNLSLPPGLRQALQHVIAEELQVLVTAVNNLEYTASRSGAFDLAKFKTAFDTCQKELSDLRHKVANLEAGLNVWQEIAERRQADADALRREMAALTFQIAALQSSLDNRKAAHD